MRKIPQLLFEVRKKAEKVVHSIPPRTGGFKIYLTFLCSLFLAIFNVVVLVDWIELKTKQEIDTNTHTHNIHTSLQT